MAMAQVRDVATRAGVSPATVSNALNHPEKVSASTLDRVHTAIKELGYVRNDAARQLRAGSNPAVGMIVLDAANPYFTEVAQGAEEHLASHSRPLLLGNSAQLQEREETYLDLFEQQRVSGILITPVGDSLERLRTVREHGTAVVIVDRHSTTEDFSSVAFDDEQGGYLAADHLIDTGAQHIAVLGGPANLRQVQDRLHGARRRADLTTGTRVSFHDTGAMDTLSGKKATEQLLELPQHLRPDAIFATNDLVALGALQVLALHGVSVPEEIRLVGFDDIEFAASATVPITSVRQPAWDMGTAAGELLRQAIESPGLAVEHRIFRPELMVRNSTIG